MHVQYVCMHTKSTLLYDMYMYIVYLDKMGSTLAFCTFHTYEIEIKTGLLDMSLPQMNIHVTFCACRMKAVSKDLIQEGIPLLAHNK